MSFQKRIIGFESGGGGRHIQKNLDKKKIKRGNFQKNHESPNPGRGDMG